MAHNNVNGCSGEARLTTFTREVFIEEFEKQEKNLFNLMLRNLKITSKEIKSVKLKWMILRRAWNWECSRGKVQKSQEKPEHLDEQIWMMMHPEYVHNKLVNLDDHYRKTTSEFMKKKDKKLGWLWNGSKTFFWDKLHIENKIVKERAHNKKQKIKNSIKSNLAQLSVDY